MNYRTFPFIRAKNHAQSVLPSPRLGQDMEEMTGMMKKVPLVRHALLLYFQELKVKHKEIIREELEKDT